MYNQGMYIRHLEFLQRSKTQKTKTDMKATILTIKDGTLDASWNVGKIIFLRHKYRERLSRNKTPTAITKGYKRIPPNMYHSGCNQKKA